MDHAAYGLNVVGGLWRATCSCGWCSAPSADLAGQTDELDHHLRVVVVSEQRSIRVSRSAAAVTLQVVDHTLLLGGLLIALVLAVPGLARRG